MSDERSTQASTTPTPRMDEVLANVERNAWGLGGGGDLTPEALQESLDELRGIWKDDVVTLQTMLAEAYEERDHFRAMAEDARQGAAFGTAGEWHSMAPNGTQTEAEWNAWLTRDNRCRRMNAHGGQCGLDINHFGDCAPMLSCYSAHAVEIRRRADDSKAGGQ